MLSRDEIVQRVLEAQADLQVGLGFLRLEKKFLKGDSIQAHNLDFAEDRLARALAQFHKLTHELGLTMASSATHPEVWDGP